MSGGGRAMEQHPGWCPQCGDHVNYLYPACAKDNTPAPLYVEVNAVAQYLAGVNTFVEFRLINTAAEAIRIEAFEVHVGDTPLAAGIYSLEDNPLIQPGVDQALIVDREVNLDAARIRPGRYQLSVMTTFSSAAGRFSMRGRHTVLFDHPGVRHIRVVDPRDDTEVECSLDKAPELPSLHGLRFGEETASHPALTFIQRMKRQHGLCFAPVRMRYESAQPRGGYDIHCRQCGVVLVEGGRYCHACRATVPLPPPIAAPPQDAVRAYCSHCLQPRGKLRGRHVFCPICGGTNHLYLDVKSASCYMESIQDPLILRIAPCYPAQATLEDLKVYLGQGDKQIECPLDNFWPQLCFTPQSGPVEFEALIECPSERIGTRRLHVEATYTCEGRRYTLAGNTNIKVIPSDSDKQTIINNFGAQSVSAAESVVSGGAWDIKVQGSAGGGKREEFITKLLKVDLQQAAFKPVRMHVQDRGPIEKPRSALPPAPDWPPRDRARIFFMEEDGPHNYCLFSKRQVLFGRSAKSCDARLLEVENCLPRMRQQRERGEEIRSMSSISGKQWEVRPELEGIQVRHCSKNNVSYLPGDKKVRQSDTPHLLGRNEYIEIPGVIGLTYVTNAMAYARLPVSRERARKALEQMTPPPAKTEPWSGNFGAFTLTRRYSLAGDKTDPPQEFGGFEAYVLLPGWATLGASRDACIMLPAKDVASLHAYLLFVDGYYFIEPFDNDTPVAVEDEPVRCGWPRPLKPGATLACGGFECHFDEYAPLHLPSKGV